jgi:outer membrane protein assembly factor BamB
MSLLANEAGDPLVRLLTLGGRLMGNSTSRSVFAFFALSASLLWNSPEARADFPWSAAHPWSYVVPGAAAPQVVCEGPTYLGRCFVWGGRDLTLGFPLDVLRAPDPQEPATLAWAVNFAAPVAGIAIGAPYGSEMVFVTSGDGFLYAFNGSDAAQQWSVDTRRASCALGGGYGDSLLAPPARATAQTWFSVVIVDSESAVLDERFRAFH